MDLRAYYRAIRQVETSIPTPSVVVVSLDTDDGGKEGRLAEVPRGPAARLIVEKRVRLASEEETNGFLESQAIARQEAEAKAAAQRMQVVVVPGPELRGSRPRPVKE